MNKAEELREILNNIPTDENKRMIQQFMENATELLKRYRRHEKMPMRKIAGICIPFKLDILYFSEMHTYFANEKIGHNYEKVLLTKDIIKKFKAKNDAKKFFKSFGICLDEKTANECGYVYRFANGLVDEGFEVDFIFVKNQYENWRVSKLIVYF